MKKIQYFHTVVLSMGWHDGRRKPEFTSLIYTIWRFGCLLLKIKNFIFLSGLLSFCPIHIVSLFYKVNRADLFSFAWTLLRAASLHQGVFLFSGLTNFKQPEDAIAFIRWNLPNPPVQNPHISPVVFPSVFLARQRLCLWAPSQHFKAWPQLGLFLSSHAQGSQAG